MRKKEHYFSWKFTWGWIFGLIILILLIRPAFHTLKSWRSEIFLKRAEHALAKGDLTLAKEQSLLCLQLQPGQIKAVRFLARLADQKNDPSSIDLWMHIVQSKDVTDSDRLALGETALREGVPVLAEQQLTILLSRTIPGKEVYTLAGLISMQQKRYSPARAWFRKALAIDPHYIRAEVNLAHAELFLNEGMENEVKTLNSLQAFGLRNDVWGLESLRMLVHWNDRHPSRFSYNPKLAEQLKKHPLAQIQDQLLAADWEIQAYPDRTNVLVESVIESAKGIPTARREFGAWLNRHKLFKRTLEVFPLDPQLPQGLILVQMDALAALGRWDQLQDFLSQDVLSDQPVLKMLFSARAARELGNKQLFDLGWHQAIRQANDSPSLLIYLADYADKIGEPARCIEIYEILSQFPGYQIEALIRLARLYEHLGETQNLLQTMVKLLSIRPNDPSVLNDVTYLGLLLNDSSPAIMEHAQQVYKANPQLPAFAATYALAQLKGGSPSVSLQVFKTIPFKELTAPGWQAVYAAVLAANGDKTEAAKIVREIDLKNLKPEEKQLISNF